MPVGADRTLRRRVRDSIHSELDLLEFPANGTLEDLCERLGQRRDRRIDLHEAALPVPGPFGYWMALDEHDVVVYPQQASPEHRKHIILHELGHMILGHEIDDERSLHNQETEGEGAPAVVSSSVLSFARRWSTLERRSYDAVIEREAEFAASVLQRRVRGFEPPEGIDPVTRRVQDALGGDDPR